MVRTKRLAAHNSLPLNTNVLLYTAPAGETVILKDWRASTQADATSRAILSVNSGSVGVVLLDGPLNATETRGAQPWIVLLPGDQIFVFSATGNVNWWLSGTELEGLAD